MPRQRAERGSITKVARDRYRIRYWGDRRDGKGYRRLSATFSGTLTEARRERDRLIVRDTADTRRTYTVREVFETVYWPDCERRLAVNTLNQYRSCWKCHIEPVFGARKMGDVRPMEIQGWLDGMSKHQATRALDMLTSIYRCAVRFEICERNPCDVGFNMPVRVREMDKGVYTMAEMSSMAKALRGSRLEGLFLLSAFGSCRPGEALAVDPRSVAQATASNGLVCALVPIEREVVRGVGIQDRTKTEMSTRTVIVPGPWGERLIEVAAERISGNHGLFIENRSGGPITASRLKERWERECARIGAECHPFRNLRNSWRTSWEYELKIDPGTLERLMGHVGRSVSAKHYVRANNAMLVDTVAEAVASYIEAHRDD